MIKIELFKDLCAKLESGISLRTKHIFFSLKKKKKKKKKPFNPNRNIRFHFFFLVDVNETSLRGKQPKQPTILSNIGSAHDKLNKHL